MYRDKPAETPITHPIFARSDPAPVELDHAGYRTLSDFRYLIRRFLEFSEAAARRAGLTARQHQALLAIKGFSPERSPTVGDLARRLLIRHHSAVELVDRLVEAGLCARVHDPNDRRRVMLRLTEAAESGLAGLSAAHLEELRSLRPGLLQLLDRLEDFSADPKGPSERAD
jgi:DNA-binding MarR family transcriptional regulator